MSFREVETNTGVLLAMREQIDDLTSKVQNKSDVVPFLTETPDAPQAYSLYGSSVPSTFDTLTAILGDAWDKIVSLTNEFLFGEDGIVTGISVHLSGIIGAIAGVITEAVQAMLDWYNMTLGPALQAAVADIAAWWDLLDMGVQDAISNVAQWWDGISTGIQTAISNAGIWFDGIGSHIASVLSDFGTFWNGLVGGTDLLKLVNAVFSIDDIQMRITDALGATWTAVEGFFADISAGIFGALGAAWTFFNDNVVTPLETWWNAISIPTGVTDNFPNRMFYGVLGATHTFIDFVLDSLLDDGRDSSTIVGHIDRVLDKLFAVAADISNRILTVVFGEDLSQAIRDGIKLIGTFWGGLGTTIREAAEGLIEDPLGWLGDQVTTIINTIFTNAHSFIDRILDTVLNDGQDSNNAIQHITRIWNKILGLGSDFTNGITGALGTLWDDVVSFFSTISSGLTAAQYVLSQIADGVVEGVTDGWHDFTNSLQSGLASASDTLSDLFGYLQPRMVYADTDSTETGRVGGGDIDFKTYDARRIDRLFFESNDGIDTGSSKAHISGQGGAGNARSLFSFVPGNNIHSWYIGSVQEMSLNRFSGLTVDESITAVENLLAGGDVRVGHTTSGLTTNGRIFRDGLDTKVYSGGMERNFSDIGMGGGITESALANIISSQDEDTNLSTSSDYFPIQSGTSIKKISYGELISDLEDDLNLTVSESALASIIAAESSDSSLTSVDNFALQSGSSIKRISYPDLRSELESDLNIDAQDPTFQQVEDALSEANSTNATLTTRVLTITSSGTVQWVTASAIAALL